MKKRVLSLLIVFAMIVSMVPVGTLAVNSGGNNEKDKIIYVSIGDSMTNGYGNDGYDGESGIANYAMQTYSNLFAAWLAGYDGEIIDDQVIFDGANAIVDHRQLAMSGMRAEDLHWLLELDHTDEEMIDKIVNSNNNSWDADLWYSYFKTGDRRTYGDLVSLDYRLADGAAKILATYADVNGSGYGYFMPSYGQDKVATAVNGLKNDAYWPEDKAAFGDVFLQIGAEFYQESVKDADVISLALGNTNFGTYMLNEITDVIMYGDLDFADNYDIERVYALADLDPALEATVRDMVDKYDEIVVELFGSLAGGDEAKLEAIKSIVTFCALSYAVNYIGAVDAILTLNPDAKIIQVALMNAYADEAEGIEDITLGDMVDIMYTPANAFIAALPAAMQATGNKLYENATFYYAEADSVGCMVEVFGDDFYKDAEGEYVKYPGLLNGSEDYEANLNSTVRDRFFDNIINDQTFDVLVSIGIITNNDRNSLTVEEIAKYDQMTAAEKAAYAAADSGKAKAIALYLAFENAHIKAGKGTVTMESLAALGKDITEVFGGLITGLPEQAQGAIDEACLLAASTAIADRLNTGITNSGTGFKGTTTATDILSVYLAADKDAKATEVGLAIAKHTVNAAIIEALAKEGVYASLTEEKYVAAYNAYATANSLPYTWEQFKLYGGNNYTLFVEGVKAQAWAQYGTYATGLAYEQAAATLKDYIKDAAGNVGSLCYLLVLPQVLSDAMVNDSTLSGILCMNARCVIGTGIGGHPSEGGHVSLYQAVKSAYEDEYTSANKTLDNLYNVLVDDSFLSTADKVAAFEMLLDSLEPTKEVKTFKEIYAFLSSNPDYLTDEQTIAILIEIVEALRDDLSLSEAEVSDLVNFIFDMFMEKDDETKRAIALGIFNILKANGYIMGYDALINNVWNQWVDHYGTDVEKTISKLVARVEARWGTYEKMLLTLNTEMEELVATKDALEAELVVLKAQLAVKKAELEAVIKMQEIGSVTAPDINIDVELGNNTQTTVPENDCTVGGDSVQAELEKAVADLEHAIAVLEALISDISADIADMAKLAAELAEAVKELGKTAGEIAAAAKDLMEAVAAIKDVMTNESAYATAAQFKKAFEAAKASAVAALDALKVASVVADELMVDVEYMLGEIITDGEALYEKIKADLPLVIENAPMEVKIALAAALMIAEEKGWDKEWAEGIIRGELDEIIAEYQPEIEKAEKELAELKAKIELEVAAKYAMAEAQLKAEAAAKIAALEAKKAALKAELLTLKAQLATAEGAVRDTIQAQIDRVNNDLAVIDADIAHVNEHLIAALEIAYNEIVAEINALHAEAIAKLEKLIADLKAELEAAIGKSLDELIALGMEGLIALKNELVALGKEGMAILVEKLIELHEMMIFNATHGEVLAGLNTKYVALGDGTNDFSAVLAEMLKGKTPANFEFVNATKPGMTAADVAAALPADVIGADLITLGFSQTEMIGAALSAFLNGEEMNWVELVGEDVAPYAAIALEYAYGEIDAMDLDETTATMVKAIAEAYAYAAADYAINLPILINNIRKVNPTAEIVIVGVHNPLTNLAIELPIYGKIDLSQFTGIFDYLIDGVYGYGAALAVIAKDVTYVHAPEVEIEQSNLGLKEIDALLKGDISALYPSANGDAYIAEQIMNALTVTVLGDANGDGVVDSYDAALIARYDIGLIGANDLNLSVCDFNEDGVVDSYDAALIARYDVGLLAA